MVLIFKALREDVRALIGWSILVAITAFGYMSFYKIMVTTGAMKDIAEMIDSLPPIIKGFLGMGANLNTLNGFVQALVYNGIPPLFFTVFACLGSLSIVTREVDARTMEFVLAHPIHRWSVIGGRGIVLLAELAVLELVLCLAAWGGGILTGSQPDLHLFIIASVSSWMLYFCLAGIFTLISVAIDDYQKGLFIILGAGFLLFFAGVVLTEQKAPGMIASNEVKGTASQALIDALGTINPYKYNDIGKVMQTGSLVLKDAVVLLGSGIAAWTLAAIAFGRKQIA